MLLYVPHESDTWSSIAKHFLGGEEFAWQLVAINKMDRPKQRVPVAVPIRPQKPLGLRESGYQVVPILCYHRFGKRSTRMTVSTREFAAQMAALRDGGYSVIPLSDLIKFLEGKKALPQRSVVITVDDGYSSFYQEAYPILRDMGFPATIFVYTDFIGARDALTWAQVREMVRSGIIDVQPHSRKHENMAELLPSESDAQYLVRIRRELTIPRDVIQQQVGTRVWAFAYPYGDANESVLNEIPNQGYSAGLTVIAGGNAFFAHPYALHRTMIYGGDTMDCFLEKAETHRKHREYKKPGESAC